MLGIKRDSQIIGNIIMLGSLEHTFFRRLGGSQGVGKEPPRRSAGGRPVVVVIIKSKRTRRGHDLMGIYSIDRDWPLLLVVVHNFY